MVGLSVLFSFAFHIVISFKLLQKQQLLFLFLEYDKIEKEQLLTIKRAKRKEEQRCKTDDIFFVVFPMMFLLFNLIYWPMCLKGQEDGTTGD